MKRVCEAPRCVEEYTPYVPGPEQRYCSPACRAAASRARAKAGPAKDGTPAHGHRVVPTPPRVVGDEWSYHWRCTGCGETWPQPLDVAELEDVECDSEAGQGRAA